MTRFNKILGIILSSILLTLFQNCSNNYKIDTSGSQGNSATSTPLDPNAPVICDPFGGSGVASSQQGLVANGVYYVTDPSNDPDGAIGNSVEGFFSGNAGVSYASASLFLSDIDFPDMYFDQGFKDASGDALKTSSGQTLEQYFGFRAESVFVAGGWAPGDYQIAILSDDGSILSMTGGQANGSDLVINNDMTHSMQMGCTTAVLHISADSQIPMSLDYYQGPPVTIGLMMMYRPVSLVGSAQDPLCGKGASSDSYFFLDHDSNNNAITAVPQAPYLQLTGAYNASTKSGGWKVVESSHFMLPANITNTCTTP